MAADLPFDVIAVLLLAAVVSVGWPRWIRPNKTEFDAQAKVLLALATHTIAAAATVSPIWWMAFPARDVVTSA
jgi:hypothetical protein